MIIAELQVVALRGLDSESLLLLCRVRLLFECTSSDSDCERVSRHVNALVSLNGCGDSISFSFLSSWPSHVSCSQSRARKRKRFL